VTGGPWYSDQDLDANFILAVRRVVLKLVDTEGPVSPVTVAEKLALSGVSTVLLKPGDVQQVMDVLVYDGELDYEGGGKRRMRALAEPSRAVFGPGEKMAPAAEGDDDDDYDYVGDAGGGGRGGGGASSSSAAGGSGSAALAIAYDEVMGGGLGRGGSGGGDDEEGGPYGYSMGDEGDDDDELHRRYVRVPRAPHYDHFTAAPCGVCPVFEQCRPGGVISPSTCVYYSAWLNQ
jgi:hypothetical protein